LENRNKGYDFAQIKNFFNTHLTPHITPRQN
jgi:hypothetical protein